MPLSTPAKNALIWGAAILAFALVLWLLGPVLTPFAVAAVLAYVLGPAVDRLQGWAWRYTRLRLPRWLLVLLVELLALLAVLGLLLLLVPVLVREWPLLRAQLPGLLDRLNGAVQPMLEQLGMTVTLDLAGIKSALMSQLSSNLDDSLASVMKSLQIGGSVALTLLGHLVLIPVALYYLLLDWRRLLRRLREWVPPRLHESCDGFAREADEVLGHYLRGQLLVMCVLAVYYSVGLSLFGLDLALPIGIFTGLAICIPYVGFGVGLLLALLAGLLEFGGQDGGMTRVALMLAVVYGIGQTVESFYLTPRLVGDRIGLHPLAVIFALLAFGQLFGFVGILVALPVSAVLLVAARRLRRSYRDSSLYRDEPDLGAG
jgi:predicted PurR-regulated permease PerM